MHSATLGDLVVGNEGGSVEASTKPLRKCRVCGLEAHSEEDLKLFAKDHHGNKLGRENFCFKCFNAYRRERMKKLQEKGLCPTCGKPVDRQGLYCANCLSEKKTKYGNSKGNRETIRLAHRRRRWERRKQVINKLGGKCVVCGITDIRVLTINHKNGRNMSRTVDKNPWAFYSSILRGERTDVEVRCFNCNILYEYERGNRWQPEDYVVELLEATSTKNLE